MRWLPFLLVLSLCAALLGCQVEVYRGLTEAQVNTMLSTLLKRGIRAEKTAAGKAGFTLSVDEDQLVQSLEILKENNLPRADYENLGKVFSGQGMISSASEEQARMAYAISQELSDTFSRIDGVLTARVHVVLGVNDKVNNITIAPSAAVFLRHTLDSPVVNLVPEIRELVAGAVASLKYDNVSVMLVPVRESVTVPDTKLPSPLLSPGAHTPALLLQMLAMAAVLLALGVGGWVYGRRLLARRRAAREALEAREGDDTGKQGEA